MHIHRHIEEHKAWRAGFLASRLYILETISNTTPLYGNNEPLRVTTEKGMRWREGERLIGR